MSLKLSLKKKHFIYAVLCPTEMRYFCVGLKPTLVLLCLAWFLHRYEMLCIGWGGLITVLGTILIICMCVHLWS